MSVCWTLLEPPSRPLYFICFKAWSCVWKKCFCISMGQDHIQQMQFHFLSEHFMLGPAIIIILNNLDFVGFGNHILQIWIPVITFHRDSRKTSLSEIIYVQLKNWRQKSQLWWKASLRKTGCSYEKFHLTSANVTGCIRLNMILYE